ncbi:MAG: DUF1109 domain-containing protein [Sphingorhabdus sp.]
MMKMTQRSFDIAALVDELEPVKPISPRNIIVTAAIITMVALAIIVSITGVRADLLAGKPEALFLLRSGILGLLGFASAYSVLAMASPSVGKHHSSWQMALVGAILFPLAGIVALATGDTGLTDAPLSSGLACLFYSAVTAAATAIPMVVTLRKGAPTSPERAGWLTGVASGGLGTLAYNFHCPYDSLVYTGVWYGCTVAVCAVAGRLIVPKLIRW